MRILRLYEQADVPYRFILQSGQGNDRQIDPVVLQTLVTSFRIDALASLSSCSGIHREAVPLEWIPVKVEGHTKISGLLLEV